MKIIFVREKKHIMLIDRYLCQARPQKIDI